MPKRTEEFDSETSDVEENHNKKTRINEDQEDENEIKSKKIEQLEEDELEEEDLMERHRDSIIEAYDENIKNDISYKVLKELLEKFYETNNVNLMKDIFFPAILSLIKSIIRELEDIRNFDIYLQTFYMKGYRIATKMRKIDLENDIVCDFEKRCYKITYLYTKLNNILDELESCYVITEKYHEREYTKFILPTKDYILKFLDKLETNLESLFILNPKLPFSQEESEFAHKINYLSFEISAGWNCALQNLLYFVSVKDISKFN